MLRLLPGLGRGWGSSRYEVAYIHAATSMMRVFTAGVSRMVEAAIFGNSEGTKWVHAHFVSRSLQ